MARDELIAYALRHRLSASATDELVAIFDSAVESPAGAQHNLAEDTVRYAAQPVSRPRAEHGLQTQVPIPLHGDQPGDQAAGPHLALDRLMPESSGDWTDAERAHVESCAQCWFDALVMAYAGEGSAPGTTVGLPLDDPVPNSSGEAPRAPIPEGAAQLVAQGALCVDRARFDSVEWVGNGASGPVFKVRDVESGAHCALKVLVDVGAETVVRIQSELPALESLAHASVCAPVQMEASGDHWTVLSRWVPGQTLGRWLASANDPAGSQCAFEVTPLEVWIAMARIGLGLLRLHEAGLVHGHLSLPKVKVTPGSAVLLEAGLWTAQPSGRDPWVSYLAPECREGGPRGPKADLFSLGMLLERALDVVGPHSALETLATQLTADDPGGRPGAADALLVLMDAVRTSAGGGIRRLDLGLIGAGGMAEVRRVRDARLRRTVAMKVIKPELAADTDAVSRFVSEAQVTAQLEHPGVIPVYGMSELEDGRPCFTMKEVTGYGLDEVIDLVHAAAAGGDLPTTHAPGVSPWTFRRLIDAFRRVCETMAYAHDRGVVHRDLKPENIMVGRYGEVLVLDWGLAKLVGTTSERMAGIEMDRGSDSALATLHGWVMGTPSYMPPEQARGNLARIDARSDVYSLGATLYEILTGQLPYEGKHPTEVVRQVLSSPPPVPRERAPQRSIPAELEEVCLKAMARDPEDRYGSAADLADAVASYLEGRKQHERALAIARDAHQKMQEASVLRSRARDLLHEAEALFEDGEPTEEAWAQWTEARALARQAQQLELDAEDAYRAALVHAPDLPDAHRPLAVRRVRDWEAAQKMSEPHAMQRALRLARAHLDFVPLEDPVRVKLAAALDSKGIHEGLVRHTGGAFVGRHDVLGEMDSLRAEGAQLITLVGTAGVGKTRLSKEHALGAREAYPSGVWFADLTEARDAMGIANAVARCLGVPLTQKDPIQQLGWAIAGRGPMLLVLDNFEQVAPHAHQTIGQWLTMAPQAHLMVTSRKKLELDDEIVVNVGPLSVLSALELFVARARAHRPGLSLSTKNRALILGMVRRLDCIALAIELAAARVGMLTLPDLSARLEERFSLLRTRLRAKDKKTLEGAIDWSWQLLAPASQSALAQTSVFCGGFDLCAAEAVLDLSGFADAPAIIDVLEALCDDHLLRRKLTRGHPVRYSLFESIRVFGQQKIGDQAEPVAMRHGEFYAQLGAEVYRESFDAGGRSGRKQIVILERDNLLAGVQTGIKSGRPGVAAGCALGALGIFVLAGPYHQGAELLRQALSLDGIQANDQMNLRGGLGTLLRFGGWPVEAQEHLEVALTIARELNDLGRQSALLGTLGLVHQAQGSMSEALNHFGAALDIAREDGNRAGEADVLGHLGSLHREQGRIPEAQEHYEASLAITRELGDRHGEGLGLGNLSSLQQAQGLADQAHALYQATLTIVREVETGGPKPSC